MLGATGGLVAVLLLLGIGSASAAFAGNQTCTTNPSLNTANGFLKIINDCYITDGPAHVATDIANLIIEWFSSDQYLYYTVVVLLVIPVLSWTNGGPAFTSESAAGPNRIRLQTLNLLFRIATAVSWSVWLQAVIGIGRPCLCSTPSSPAPFFPAGVTTPWSLPSEGMMAATIVSLHFIEYVNVPVGVLLPVLIGTAEVLLGWANVAQLLGAVAAAIIIHFYMTRTPHYMRIVDIGLTIVAGLSSLVLTKQAHVDVDYAWAVRFFNGLVWQIYFLKIFFVLFRGHLKPLLRTKIHTFTAVRGSGAESVPLIDFLPGFQPINDDDGVGQPDAVQRPRELLYTGISTAITFAILVALKVARPYMDDILNSFGK